MFLRESNKIACLEAENAKLRDLALKLTSQVRVLREALRDVPSENCRNQRPQVWERYLGSGQPIGLMEKTKHDAPGAAAASPRPPSSKQDERFRLAMAAAGYIATTPSTKPGTKAPVSNYTGTD